MILPPIPVLVLLLLSFATTTTVVFSQTTTTTETPPIDPETSGRPGSPGAVFRLNPKGLDFVSWYGGRALIMLVQSMPVENFYVYDSPNGQFWSDYVHFVSFETANQMMIPYQLVPPNRFVYRINDARAKIVGNYTFKPISRKAGKHHGGEHKFVATAADICANISAEWSRTSDGKPTIKSIDCKIVFNRFDVDFFLDENVPMINGSKMRPIFEEAMCKTIRSTFKDIVNYLFSTFPSRVLLGDDNKYTLDYSLMYRQPVITNKSLCANLKGEVSFRSFGGTPFYPPAQVSQCGEELSSGSDTTVTTSTVTTTKMLSFYLSDFAFNSLLHHAHWQKTLDMAASQWLPESSPLRQRLRLRCPGSETRRAMMARQQQPQPEPACFEDVFGPNITDSYEPTDTGELIYRSDGKTPAVRFGITSSIGWTRKVTRTSQVFDARGGILEAYAVLSFDGKKRELLARSYVDAFKGEFTPIMVANKNISAIIKVTEFRLSNDTNSRRQPGLVRNLVDLQGNWRILLARLATPIVEAMMNEFFARYAQFPIPMVEGVECQAPIDFTVRDRWIKIDCDMRAINGDQALINTRKNGVKVNNNRG